MTRTHQPEADAIVAPIRTAVEALVKRQDPLTAEEVATVREQLDAADGTLADLAAVFDDARTDLTFLEVELDGIDPALEDDDTEDES